MQLTNMIGAWAIGWCWKLAMAVLVMGFTLLYPSYELRTSEGWVECSETHQWDGGKALTHCEGWFLRMLGDGFN